MALCPQDTSHGLKKKHFTCCIASLPMKNSENNEEPILIAQEWEMKTNKAMSYWVLEPLGIEDRGRIESFIFIAQGWERKPTR